MPRSRLYEPILDDAEQIKAWVRAILRRYRFGVRGILLDNNEVLPIPFESSVIAKLIEMNLLERFRTVAHGVRGLDVFGAPNSRTYPDIWLTGDRLGGRRVALEVKCARRAAGGHRTMSRITLGPFDKYFRFPDEKMSGCVLPYGAFALHLDIIVLYDYEGGEVLNVEPLVVETWRVGSRRRSSGTRDYIGAVTETRRLRDEDGDFATQEEFYEYWRTFPLRPTGSGASQNRQI